jgi:hypothetical protein
MEEDMVVGTAGDAAGGTPDASQQPEPAAGEAAEAAARLPDVTAWLPGNMWLYAVPVILLLILWVFYPVILVLICIILALWWLG